MLKELKYYRMALGVNMIWNAYPVITTFRDALGIGPQGPTFTAIYWMLGILCILPINIFQRIYLPNKVLLCFWLSFIALCVIYMKYYPGLFFNYYQFRNTEFLYLGFTLLSLIALMYYPNEHVEKILWVAVIYTTIGNLGLIWGIIHDPKWTIGQRAAITFRSGNASNPHTFAINAVYCILASMVAAGSTKQFLIKIACYASAFLGLVVMILCRSSSSILGLLLICGVYTVLNWQRLINTIKKPRTYYTILAITLMGYIALQRSRYSNLLLVYSDTIIRRFYNVIYSISGSKVGSDTSAVGVDLSFMGRVYSYEYVAKKFSERKWLDLAFGEGYKSRFLDIPVLEALLNQGILGFLLFNTFLVFIYINSLLQILRPPNRFSLYLGYFSFMLMTTSISGGRPTDSAWWCVHIVYIRFIGIWYPTPEERLAMQTAQ
jgi:hypothetical protein